MSKDDSEDIRRVEEDSTHHHGAIWMGDSRDFWKSRGESQSLPLGRRTRGAC